MAHSDRPPPLDRPLRPLRLRRLESTDLEALLALYEHLHDSDAPPPSREAVDSVWRELMASPNHRYYGVFVNEETLVSSGTLTIIPNLTRGCRPYGVVENVVTHPRHRRKGHAKALLAKALAEAWAAGCYKVMLLTGRKDEETLQFYESAGFDRHAKQAFVAKPG
jgi:GNAT superfamily N-acetyltransferase